MSKKTVATRLHLTGRVEKQVDGSIIQRVDVVEIQAYTPGCLIWVETGSVLEVLLRFLDDILPENVYGVSASDAEAFIYFSKQED